jgi:hypothetical protein
MVNLHVANAQRPADLAGPFAYGGGSVSDDLNSAGAGASVGTGTHNRTVAGGEFGIGFNAPVGLPFETHAGESYSWVVGEP